jgi:hypothetical protein
MAADVFSQIPARVKAELHLFEVMELSSTVE